MGNTKFSAEYREYIKSFDWYIKSKSAIERADHRCQICGMYPRQGTTLQVHHKTYANLGHEPMEDLLVVCEDCHTSEHADKDEAQRKRMMTFARHYIKGYENKSEEQIRYEYNNYIRKISGGKKR